MFVNYLRNCHHHHHHLRNYSSSVVTDPHIVRKDVSMPPDKFCTVESLKLYLGTLFLSCYRLPEMHDVETVIEEVVEESKREKVPFGTLVEKMLLLLEKIYLKRSELLMFGKGEFLGPFLDRLNTFGCDSYPTDLEDSGVMFFRKFFKDSSKIELESEEETELKIDSEEEEPLSDLEEIVEWCLFVVQFEEATHERIVKAINFLYKVKVLIENRKQEYEMECDMEDYLIRLVEN